VWVDRVEGKTMGNRIGLWNDYARPNERRGNESREDRCRRREAGLLESADGAVVPRSAVLVMVE
jgi:hypothetical protein